MISAAWISNTLTFCGAVTALLAAYYWWKSSTMKFPPAPEFKGLQVSEPFRILFSVLTEASALNKKAAGWTAVSVVFNTILVLYGPHWGE